MPVGFTSVAISQQSSKETIANRVEVAFGNGYTQQVPNGINYLRDHISAKWDNISNSEYVTIIGFLDSLETGDYTTWTSPYDTTQKKYVLEGGRSISSTSGNTYSINQKFKQVY